jgi:CO/xanthine dehydrogenase Mo-binding subunit
MRLQARALDRVREGGGGEVRLGSRPSPKRAAPATVVTGAASRTRIRSQTVVAEIAEVEVNRTTGRVWVKRLVCAHDCGLVVNPEALTRTIENGMLHASAARSTRRSRSTTRR